MSQSFEGPPDDVVHDVDVLFDAGGLLVLDKPAGLAMLPGMGVEREASLEGAVRSGFPVEPGFAGPSFLGRLDRPTSGLVVAALSRSALHGVLPAWTRGAIHKDYLVVVHGRTDAEGDINIALAGRLKRHRAARRDRVNADGASAPADAPLAARTTFSRIAGDGAISLLVARLHTGRTHQIRRHMKAIGHPVVGDDRYGHAARELKLGAAATELGLQLHAWRLQHAEGELLLPSTLTAPPPSRMRVLLGAHGVSNLDAVLASWTLRGAH